MMRLLLSTAIVLCAFTNVNGQCFATAGNPMGGSGNLGVMKQGSLRTMAFYRHHFASQYYEGSNTYDGPSRLYRSARYNYLGTVLAYGITDRLTGELETGYFLDKTLTYLAGDFTQQGFGFSNGVTSLKYALYRNRESRFEIAGSAGASIPFSRKYQRIDGIELPEDAQPSIAAFGLVLQSFVIKENSFTAMRYFWINRFETYSVNPKGELFGNSWSSAAFVSRHFVFGDGAVKDWTAILQLRYHQRGQTVHRETGNVTKASGGRQLLLVPQVNCTVKEKWNISILLEKPLYQYQNGIQLGVDYAVLLNVARDFQLVSKQNPAP